MARQWIHLLSSEWWPLARGHGGSSRAGRRGRRARGAGGRATGDPGRAAAAAGTAAALGVASVLQTIPSLALLGFLLIAFRGQIGKAPALAALVLYALLPIVKNTILGLQSIDPGIREAAVALGMTRLAAASPGRAAACRADPAGWGARGDGRLGRHGDDRGGHRRTRVWAATSSAGSPCRIRG